MDHESEYLLHLMGAYLREAEPEGAADADWKQLQHLAHINNLTGVFDYMAMTYDLCPEAAASMRQVCMATITGYANRAAMAEMLSGELTRQGIDHILMKGYVLRDYFPVPELRAFGDIDLVIRREDRAKSHELMLQLGYQVKNDWEPVYSYKKPREHYEFHTELLETDISDRMDFRRYFADPWQYAEAAGEHCYRFRPEFHFLYLLVHLAKHIHGSGAGIRLYMDIAAFARHFGNDLDWNWIRGELEKLQFTDFAGTVLDFVQRYFGIGSPITPGTTDAGTLEALAEFTVSGGVFGRSGHDSAAMTMKSEKPETTRLGAVLRKLFPAAKTIESRYTYLQGRPWLLPVAWIHRLVKTRAALCQHTREARELLSADREEIRNLQNLIHRIGL